MPTQGEILRYLSQHPQKTVGELAVSSLLAKMVDQGLLDLTEGRSLGGGHVYWVLPPRRTAWERLLKDDP